MTNEDIFREVEEDLRREQIKAYWDKFGIYIIGCAAFIIIAVAGYKGWVAWSMKQAASAGTSYENARALAEDGKTEEAAKAFAKLIESGPSGYKTLSTFQLASAKVQEGKIDEAVSLFDKLAEDNGLDQVLRGFAQIQAALLRVDKADHAEMKKRLSSVAVTGKYWRHSAREILGLSAYKSENFKEALGYYDTITKDSDAPQQLKSRARMMKSLINSSMPQKESEAEKKDK